MGSKRAVLASHLSSFLFSIRGGEKLLAPRAAREAALRDVGLMRARNATAMDIFSKDTISNGESQASVHYASPCVADSTMAIADQYVLYTFGRQTMTSALNKTEAPSETAVMSRGNSEHARLSGSDKNKKN